MTAGFGRAQRLAVRAEKLDLWGHQVPTWLPAPTPRIQTRPQCSKRAQAKVARSIWIAPHRESTGEKLLMGTLTLAAAASVAYGLSMLVDLVEHWALFHSTVAQALR